MAEEPAPSAVLRSGRRAVDGREDVRILQDLEWCAERREWRLHLRVRADVRVDLVPEWTDWHVFIAPSYPYGLIEFLPSKVDGIAQTFAHQQLNADGPAKAPWRMGAPCLRTGLHVLGPRGCYRARWLTERRPT